MRRSRDERGASLLLVLGVMALAGVVITPILGMSLTGTVVAQRSALDQRRLAVATSGIDAAIQHARAAKWVGRRGLACPSITWTDGTETAIVTCASSTGPFDLDRTLTLEARVDGRLFTRAHVVIRDGTAGAAEPDVDVAWWESPGAPSATRT